MSHHSVSIHHVGLILQGLRNRGVTVPVFADQGGAGTGGPSAIGPAGAAAEGAEATVPMQARKGRASYLGARSVGHMDPGASSTALILRALADVTAKQE